MQRILIFILVYSLWSAVALACSGYGAPELIENNRSLVNVYGVAAAAGFVVSVILFFLRRRKGLWVILISLLITALHPAWFYGGGGGDCGMSMAGSAKFLTVLVGIGVAFQLRGWLVARHDPTRSFRGKK